MDEKDVSNSVIYESSKILLASQMVRLKPHATDIQIRQLIKIIQSKPEQSVVGVKQTEKVSKRVDSY